MQTIYVTLAMYGTPPRGSDAKEDPDIPHSSYR